MASTRDLLKNRGKYIDSKVDQAMGGKQPTSKQKPRDERGGGLGDDAMTRMLNKIKAEQDAKAGNKRRP